MPDPTATLIDQVLTVAVQVRDHERSLEFYEARLGFERRRDATFGPGLRWVEVAPPGAQTTVALAPSPGEWPGGRDTGIRLATESADRTHAGLKAAGVDVDDVMRFGPGVPPMFSLRDPDGNTLYVVEAA